MWFPSSFPEPHRSWEICVIDNLGFQEEEGPF